MFMFGGWYRAGSLHLVRLIPSYVTSYCRTINLPQTLHDFRHTEDMRDLKAKQYPFFAISTQASGNSSTHSEKIHNTLFSPCNSIGVIA